jgi:hypothetical protein
VWDAHRFEHLCGQQLDRGGVRQSPPTALDPRPSLSPASVTRTLLESYGNSDAAAFNAPRFRATQTPWPHRRARPSPPAALKSVCGKFTRGHTDALARSPSAQIAAQSTVWILGRVAVAAPHETRLNMPGGRVFFPQPNVLQRRWRRGECHP